MYVEPPTYAANGQREAHSVEHRGGDCTGVERVLDAVVCTEKAPLVGTDLTQVEGCQRQTSCGKERPGGITTGRVKKQKHHIERRCQTEPCQQEQ